MNHLELFSGTHSFGKITSEMGFDVVSLDRDLDASCPFTDYVSKKHHKEDIMHWDYKQYPKDFFKLITASPVCMWWSNLRSSWIGRKLKAHNGAVCTRELLDKDIDLYGKPMVDKVFEILDYFKPEIYIIENPQGSKMKHYIAESYPHYNNYSDFSYCKFCDWGYQKNTRFWNNIDGLTHCLCKKDCDNIVITNKQKIHNNRMGTSKTVEDNGKIIRCNTKALREKYKDFENLQVIKKHKLSVDGGKSKKDILSQFGTNSIFERYRIPPDLIKHILEKTL
tara:strand:- start:782 stop:1621 length:840 start_codon:yes stop_codon:yes gene_type:complete